MHELSGKDGGLFSVVVQSFADDVAKMERSKNTVVNAAEASPPNMRQIEFRRP